MPLLPGDALKQFHYEQKLAKLRKRKTKKRKTSRTAVAVKVMKDGREICQDNAAGREEYLMRTAEMATRQSNRCRCGRHIVAMVVDELVDAYRATFGHDIPRGHGGGFRDDRIELPDGTWINHAECFDCNSAKGSRRTHEPYKPCPKRPRSEAGLKGGDPPAVATELQTPIENRNEER